MKNTIIIVVLVLSTAHLEAAQRFQRLLSPARQAVVRTMQGPTVLPTVRSMSTSSQPVAQSWWQRFTGWFSKKPVTVNPVIVNHPLAFEAQVIKAQAQAPTLISQQAVLAAAIKNVKATLDSESVAAGDILGNARRKQNERLLRRLENGDKETLAKFEAETKAQISLQAMIDDGIFSQSNIDINNPKLRKEALDDIQFMQQNYLDHYYNMTADKYSTLDDKIETAEDQQARVIKRMTDMQATLAKNPTWDIAQVWALVAEKEGGRILQILEQELEKLDALKIQEANASKSE